ncbi:MAG: DNA translocase FtsK 4TM domain-containing protein [Arsenophonus sp.]
MYTPICMHIVSTLSITQHFYFNQQEKPGVLVLGQEYTEDKNFKLKKISNSKILTEVILLIITVLAMFLIVSLISFHPSDPSWLQTTWNQPIKNLAGGIGAWSSDILFSVFGILAYAIPLIMLLGCWNIYKNIDKQNCLDFFVISLQLIGGLALIVTSCSLAALNIDNLPNFSSGGIIGSVFSKAILHFFNILGTTLALLCIWAISFTLFTGCSWLTIAEKIGSLVLATISLITNRTRLNNKHQVTEDYFSYHPNKLYNGNNVDYIDPDDVLFSTSPINQLAKERLRNNSKNNELHEDKIPTLILDEIEVTFASKSETATQNKYVKDIFSKPSNIHIPMDDNVNLNKLIDTTTNTQVSDEEKNKNPRETLITSATKIYAESADINTTFTPVKSQIKKGIGPEFPRPNPIRLPTQRELYGNRLMTQKEQELDINQNTYKN